MSDVRGDADNHNRVSDEGFGGLGVGFGCYLRGEVWDDECGVVSRGVGVWAEEVCGVVRGEVLVWVEGDAFGSDGGGDFQG